MMTKEEAAKIISTLRTGTMDQRDMAMNLFVHFVEVFNITDTRSFAEECGYPIAINVRRIEK